MQRLKCHLARQTKQASEEIQFSAMERNARMPKLKHISLHILEPATYSCVRSTFYTLGMTLRG